MRKKEKKVFKNSALVRVSSSSLLLLPSRRLLYFFTKSFLKNELKFISFLTVNFVQFAASKKVIICKRDEILTFFFFFRRRNLCFSLQHPSLPGGLRTQTQRQQNGRTGQLDSHLHHSGKKTKKDELTVSSTRDQCYKFVS